MRFDFATGRPVPCTLRGTRRAVCACVCLVLGSCAQVPDSRVAEPEPPPTKSPAAAPSAEPKSAEPSTGWRQRGTISHYGKGFAGKPTASGETFDPDQLTMAHRTLPFGTLVRVTNLENRQSVEVVVNDRGPYVAGRVADLSAAAARQIGMVADGVVDAMIEVLRMSEPRPGAGSSSSAAR